MKIPRRLFISLPFALLAAGVTLIVAQAQAPQPTQPTGTMTNDNCIACHQDIATVWMTGLHGRAGTDPIFAEAWNAQGKPGACLVCHATGYDPATGSSETSNVACTSCHTPIPANHPTDKMPIDTTPDLCGKCHSDPRFATQDWQLSAHYQRGLSCSVCHDPHTAGMKTVAGATTARVDASALCENCHKDAMKNFPTSTHAEAGVTCVQCHLGFNVGNKSVNPTDFITAHTAPDHSFMPTLTTCSACHANQMHAPGQAVAAAAIKIEEAGGTPTPNPTPVATPIPLVTNQAAPVSPAGFSGIAGLLGLAGGMVLQPWLEKFYRRINGKKGAKNERQEN
jgi:predicted CXXCH cytochrome family protein